MGVVLFDEVLVCLFISGVDKSLWLARSLGLSWLVDEKRMQFFVNTTNVQ